MPSQFLITGPSGFLGGAVAAEAGSVPGSRSRLLARRPLAGEPGPAASVLRADLTDPESLRGSCEGVDVLLHCASHIGGPDELAQAVNADGTRALVAEAVRSGVRRIIYLSTAAVAGRGVYRDVDPADLPVRPSSATSRTRAEAEQAVLRAGGTVLRPHLVFGDGDRWVRPGLAHLHRSLESTVEGWSARHSVIDVKDLARLAVATALTIRDVSGVWSANHPDPVPCAELFRRLVPDFTARPPAEDIDLAEARRRLAGDPRSLHHLELLGTDHWFTSDRLWALTECPPSPTPLGRLGPATVRGW